MLRVLYAGVFLVGLACAVACGRQVTPNPTLSGLSGEIILKFRTIGTPNFLLYNYLVAVNTTGNGQEPYAIGFQNGQFQNFSYSVVTGALTPNAVLPLLVQYYQLPGTQVRYRILNFNPATTQLNLNTSSTTSYNEFQIVFQRAQLSLAPPTATTPPSPTPTPKPTKSTPTPTPSPGSGSGSGSQPTPVSSPTTSAQSTWCINLFITGPSPAGGSQVYDALGLGATDHSFSSGCFNVNESQDIVYNQPLPEANPPVDPASALYGFELVNFP